MKEKQSALNDIILASIHDYPGLSMAKTIDTVFEFIPSDMLSPSRDTIKRRIHELGARGHLYLRDEITVHLHETRETKPKEGNGDPASAEEESH
jgi:hypothetical protein